MSSRRQAVGLTLIELMVAITIFGLLLVMAAPGLSDWLANLRLRNTAEALGAALQGARSEAVARNSRVRFQLTSTLGADCTLNTSGPHWVINLDPAADATAVESNCDDALSETDAPRILSRHDGSQAAGSAALTASQSALVFNGLGRLTPAGAVSFEVKSTEANACVSDGGTRTCMHVEVSAVGQVRVCNPAVASAHPAACSS